MDPGVFLRSRRIMAVWVATPLTILVLVFLGVRWYCQRVKGTLIESRAMMEILPELLQTKERGQTVEAAFEPTRSYASRIDQITRSLNDASKRCGFELLSVTISDMVRPRTPSVRFVPVRLSGSGSLVATVRFLDEVLQADPLCSIEKATFRSPAQPSRQREYLAEVQLHFYRLDAGRSH